MYTPRAQPFKASMASIQGTSDQRFRDRLLSDGVLAAAPEAEIVVFTRDHLFRSPSMAAVAVLGRTANGWLEWKTASGKTLDALKRQPQDKT